MKGRDMNKIDAERIFVKSINMDDLRALPQEISMSDTVEQRPLDRQVMAHACHSGARSVQLDGLVRHILIKEKMV